MKIENFTRVENPKIPSIVGEFTLVTDKFTIHGCRVIKGKTGWFAAPASVRVNDQWMPSIQFNNQAHQKMFSDQMKEAVEKHMQSMNITPDAPPPQEQMELDECPF